MDKKTGKILQWVLFSMCLLPLTGLSAEQPDGSKSYYFWGFSLSLGADWQIKDSYQEQPVEQAADTVYFQDRYPAESEYRDDGLLTVILERSAEALFLDYSERNRFTAAYNINLQPALQTSIGVTQYWHDDPLGLQEDGQYLSIFMRYSF